MAVQGAEPGPDDGTPPRHPVLLRLAARLLAKADRAAQGGVLPAAVRLSLDRKELPELHGQVEAEIVQGLEWLLRDLCDTGWVRLNLSREREFSGFADRKPQIELLEFDALAAWAGYQPMAERWQRKLAAHLALHWEGPDDEVKAALLDHLARNPLAALAGVPVEDALRSLQALRDLCHSGASLPLREVSARVFHGRSKVLDNREELLRLLGAAPAQFWQVPIQLLVDIPPSLSEVLFVENLVTFERMADERRAGWQHSLLVYAAGFKGSARRLRHPNGCRIYVRASQGDLPRWHAGASGGVDAVADWLSGRDDLSVRFFGDLDFAGMQILASLREVFADAQAWQPGYGELAARLASGGGHRPEMASKERQVDPGNTGCAHADQDLLPLMRLHGRFVDQEIFGCGEG